MASPVTSEDSDEGCELEEIQKELEELRVKKEELERQGESFSVTANGGTFVGFFFPLQDLK